MIITPLTTKEEAGQQAIARLLDRFRPADTSCSQAVVAILEDVRTRGDEALVEYTRRFDAPEFSADQLRVSDLELREAYLQVDREFRESLSLAIARIQAFHEHEKEQSWTITSRQGVVTGRLVRPVDAAGLYVPGGRAGKTPLVSSVLMNGIPAGIAGVTRRVLTTPPDAGGGVHPALLVAAQEIGITEIYKMGSAWAVAALAFGTSTIPRVDVIVGPGNQYVTEAKRQVAGLVRIDMIAGPSEVLIVADHSAPAAFIAADMLAQAEHDPQALAMAIVADHDLAGQVIAEIEAQLPLLSRADIAKTSLAARGMVLIEPDLDAAIELANRIAAEHLELMIADADSWLPKIRHAGAIFLGNFSPEAAGDYLAGPNHVLPTMGTARYSSALGVETFVKKSSVISYPREALIADAPGIRCLARLEGLSAHGRSIEVRLEAVRSKE